MILVIDAKYLPSKGMKTYPTLGKRTIIFNKCNFWVDMLVPRRVQKLVSIISKTVDGSEKFAFSPFELGRKNPLFTRF